jgi:hypothetical protein
MAMTVGYTTTLDLPVKLTEEEIRTKGSEQADAVGELSRQEAEKKETVKELNIALKSTRKRINELAQAVRTGVEIRQVECRVVPVGDEMHTERLDTNETVDRRPMSEYERREAAQGRLFEDEQEDADEAEPADAAPAFEDDGDSAPIEH